MSDEYYLLNGEQQEGPFTMAQMRSMWRGGQISAAMYYWQQGMPEWLPLAVISGQLKRRNKALWICVALASARTGISRVF